MPALSEYPCLTCDGQGVQVARIARSGLVLRGPRLCPECAGMGTVPRAVVARDIVRAAIDQRQYGVGHSPYLVWAERAGDSALLEPYRKARALGPLLGD